MSAGKHTEGEWYVLGEDELPGIAFVEIASGELGTSSHRTIGWIGCAPDGISDEDRANARLIAAAPDHALACWAMCVGAGRWEPLGSGGGEFCIHGIRHVTTLDEFGCPVLTDLLRAEIIAAKEGRADA